MGFTFLNNFFLLFSAFVFTARYCSSEGFSYRLISLAVIFFVQAVLILIFWGILGKLYLINIALSAGLIFLFSFWIRKKGNGCFLSLPSFTGNKVIILLIALIAGFFILKAANLKSTP